MVEPKKPVWKVFVGEDLLCSTDWAPIAQAAWCRASRHRDYAQHGGLAVLEKDGQILAKVRPKTLYGHPWPDPDAPLPGWHDVVKSICLLLRDDGWDAKEIADAMTELGLPTTRGRIDALRGSTKGKRAQVEPAEVVVMLQAVVRKYREGDDQSISGGGG